MMAYEYINKIGEVSTNQGILKVVLLAQKDATISELDMISIRQSARDKLHELNKRKV